MGGKKEKEAQRTKGNTKPSSSARSARLLATSGGTTGFIGFSAGPSNDGTLDPAFVPLSGLTGEEVEGPDIPGEVRLVMRKMNKKDVITKLKAVQEFADLIATSEPHIACNVLPFWPRLYSRLALDHDRRIRETTQKAMAQLAAKAGRNIAPQLKQLMPTWFLSTLDPYAPAASAASEAMATAFPNEGKIRDAIIFCQEEVLIFLEDLINNQTLETLSDLKQTSQEDAESKYIRVIASSFFAYGRMLELLGNALIEKNESLHRKLLHHPQWIKHANHKNNTIRCAWFRSVTNVLLHVPKPMLTSESDAKKDKTLLDRIASTVFVNLDAKDPLVSVAAWDATIALMSHFEEWFQLTSVEKQVLPRLRKQLGNPHSCPEELFPKLLPIYGQFPNQDIIGHADLLLEDLKGVIECIPAHQENHRSATMAMAGSSKKRAAITAFFETALLILSKLSETASAAAPVEPNCHNKVCGHIMELLDAAISGQMSFPEAETAADGLKLLLGSLQKKKERKSSLDKIHVAFVNKCKHFYDSHKDQKEALDGLASFLCHVHSSHPRKAKKSLSFAGPPSEPAKASARKSQDEEAIHKLMTPLLLHLAANALQSLGPQNVNFLTKLIEANQDTAFRLALVANLEMSGQKSATEGTLNQLIMHNIKQGKFDASCEVKTDVVQLCLALCQGDSENLQLDFFKSTLESELIEKSWTTLFVEKICAAKTRSVNDSTKLFLASEEFGSTLVQTAVKMSQDIVSESYENHWQLLKVGLRHGDYLSEKTLEGILRALTVSVKTLSANVSSADLEKANNVTSLSMTFVCDLLKALLSCNRLCARTNEAPDVVLAFLAVDCKSHALKDRLSFEALQCVRETWVCGLKSLSLVCEDSEKIQKSFVKVLHDHLLHEALPDVEAVGHLFDVALELASALQIQFVHLLPQASDFSRSRCVSRVRVAFLLAWERFGPNLHFSSTLESDKDNAETKEASGKLTSNEAALVFVGQFLQRSFLDCAEHDTSIGKEEADISSDRWTLAMPEAGANLIGELGDMFVQYICSVSIVELQSLAPAIETLDIELDIKALGKFVHSLSTRDKKALLDKILTKSESSGLEWAVALRKILTLLDEEEDVELNVAKIMPVQETRSESVTQTTQVLLSKASKEFVDIMLQKEASKLLRLSEVEFAEGVNIMQATSSLALVTSCLARNLELEHSPTETENEAIRSLLKALLGIKQANETSLLFGCDLHLPEDWHKIALVQAIARSVQLLLARPKLIGLVESASWDWILCAVGSWVQTFDESQHLVDASDFGHRLMFFNFSTSTLTLGSAVAGLMRGSQHVDLDSARVPSNIYEEWTDFFADSIFSVVLNSFVKLSTNAEVELDKRLLLQSLGTLLIHVPEEQLFKHNLEPKFLVEDVDCESCYPDHLVFLLNHLSPLMTSRTRSVQMTTFNLLLRIMDKLAIEEDRLDERGSATHSSEISQQEPDLARELPRRLRELLVKTQPVVESLFENSGFGFTFGDFLPLPPNNAAHTYTMAYLLTWKLILRFISGTRSELRPRFSDFVRREKMMDSLMPTLFHLMPSTIASASPLVLKPNHITSQDRHQEIHNVATSVYIDLLTHLPALARNWWGTIDKKIADHVERFTSANIMPILWSNEIESIEQSLLSFDNMTIKVRSAVREVVAVYTVDDGSMELVIQIPANFPLGPVKVESGKKVGVGTSQWRNWMLQLTTFLQHQNGSILDGLTVWKKNVDKRFEGVEECYICFYILHGANHQLPKLACRTCKKKFHSACLYKWFSTSNNSTCPLCRNLF